MFDIGFTELLLISILALLVLGPERLPVAVKTVALWTGRLKRAWTSLRTELEKEIGADEIRQQLHNEAILKELGEDTKKLQQDFQQIEAGLQQDLSSSSHSTSGEAEAEPTESVSPTNKSGES